MSVMDNARWEREEAPGDPNGTESNDARQIVASINALAFQVRRVANRLEANGTNRQVRVINHSSNCAGIAYDGGDE